MVWNKEILYHHHLFNFALEYASRKVKAYQEELKLNGTHQFLFFAADNVLSENMHTVVWKKNTSVISA